MLKPYAKVIVDGSPITKSNFKLHNAQGRAILPSNTGKSYDKYANYEQEIAYKARIQNPNIVLEESLIAVLKVYYKSEKRHPDTSNITKSIFDGIEKSGLIVNDMQIRKIIIEEFYDKENPRFELELFGESHFDFSFNITPLTNIKEPKVYSKNKTTKKSDIKKEYNSSNLQNKIDNTGHTKTVCHLCNKEVKEGDFVTANKGSTTICRKCLLKTF
ncbi:MAG: RusA family crossover junction endodeoxyribonuclease [Sarcina sp.]